MVPVGFEPTKRNVLDLKASPFDHSGKVPVITFIITDTNNTNDLI